MKWSNYYPSTESEININSISCKIYQVTQIERFLDELINEVEFILPNMNFTENKIYRSESDPGLIIRIRSIEIEGQSMNQLLTRIGDKGYIKTSYDNENINV